MKIRIKSAENKLRLFFIFPNCLIFNRFVAPLAARKINDELSKRGGGNVSAETVLKLGRYISRFKTSHPDWCLVNVESASGDLVKIKF